VVASGYQGAVHDEHSVLAEPLPLLEAEQGADVVNDPVGGGLRDTEERGQLAQGEVGPPVGGNQQNPVFQWQRPRAARPHRVRALAAKLGEQSPERTRTQSRERGYPGGLRRRDHNSHGCDHFTVLRKALRFTSPPCRRRDGDATRGRSATDVDQRTDPAEYAGCTRRPGKPPDASVPREHPPAVAAVPHQGRPSRAAHRQRNTRDTSTPQPAGTGSRVLAIAQRIGIVSTLGLWRRGTRSSRLRASRLDVSPGWRELKASGSDLAADRSRYAGHVGGRRGACRAVYAASAFRYAAMDAIMPATLSSGTALSWHFGTAQVTRRVIGAEIQLPPGVRLPCTVMHPEHHVTDP
jgi:hypothetical protein